MEIFKKDYILIGHIVNDHNSWRPHIKREELNVKKGKKTKKLINSPSLRKMNFDIPTWTCLPFKAM